MVLSCPPGSTIRGVGPRRHTITVLEQVDHIGCLVRDLDVASASFQSRFGLALVRRFERQQFALAGVYLGAPPGTVELFTFTDSRILDERLGDAEIQLDHVAYTVKNIDVAAEVLLRSGVVFTGPDDGRVLTEAVVLGGVRHLWIAPASLSGLRIQLVER